MDIYRSNRDFFSSVLKSLEEIEPEFYTLPGVLVLGSHSPEDVDEKLEHIKLARENRVPFLGICFGMQLAIIEFARNVLNLKEANSTEIEPDTTVPIIHKMPELRVGLQRVQWGDDIRYESHWHNYKFNEFYKDLLEGHFETSYTDTFGQNVLEMIQLKDHPFFYGVQFHPEYQSSRGNPHPILKQFIDSCRLAE